MDESAVRKVFEAKRRPLSDPLIVHVVSVEEAFKLWKFATAAKEVVSDGSFSGSDVSFGSSTSDQTRVLIALMEEFWPGPLTIISQADESVPPIVTAGTGFVAARCPSHVIARQLISLAGVPIAAPSANRFGHVSPTRADHVLSDLGEEDVWVVDPGEGEHNVCSVGVESTVAKVEDGTISVLRHGAISAKDIEQCLVRTGLNDKFRVLVCVRTTGEDVPNVSPGQTIKHYSPDVPSFIISDKRISLGHYLESSERSFAEKSVILDFGGRLSWLQSSCLAYKDLSSIGSSSEAAMRVFDSLRWAELVEGAERVYFPELVVSSDSRDDALIFAIKDRLTRAASGVVIDKLQ